MPLLPVEAPPWQQGPEMGAACARSLQGFVAVRRIFLGGWLLGPLGLWRLPRLLTVRRSLLAGIVLPANARIGRRGQGRDENSPGFSRRCARLSLDVGKYGAHRCSAAIGRMT